MRLLFQLASLVAALWTVGSLSSSRARAQSPSMDGSESIAIGVGCLSSPAYPTAAADASSASSRPRFTYVVANPIAQFISLHFSQFNIPAQDYVVVRPTRGGRPKDRLVYHGTDRNAAFFTKTLFTSSVTLELYTRGSDEPADPSECLGFTVDNYRFLAQSASFTGSAQEELCGADDSQEAACAKVFNPTPFAKADAVARLLIHKNSSDYFCTGWLVGCEGHLLTNHHCINEPEHAENTQFEFRAQGANCSVDCAAPFACPGEIRATTAELIIANKELDYALVKIAGNLSADYGYLQMREAGAVLDERLYLPQHPAGWGKRIALKADTEWGKVVSLSLDGCLPEQVGYNLDTQGGSSGSPVMGYGDNAVVALHHCGGCPNTAVNVKKIVADLRARQLLPLCAAV